MAKTKTSQKPQSQAQRFLEAAKKAQVDMSGRRFAQAMGKVTLNKNARKTAKGQIGG